MLKEISIRFGKLLVHLIVHNSLGAIQVDPPLWAVEARNH